MTTPRATEADRRRRIVALCLCSVVSACESGADTSALEVLIEPTVASVAPGEQIIFSAQVLNAEDTRISWRVAEGLQGGIITVNGQYVAPDEPGTYHVVASSLANPEDYATAEIQVESFALGGVPDGLPPLAPTVNLVVPASPANENNPSVWGNAEVSSIIRIYSNSDCTGDPIGTGQASSVSGDFAVVANVADDTITTFYAQATDVENLISPCSSTFETYEEDSTPPSMPSVISVSGVSYTSSTIGIDLFSQTVQVGQTIAPFKVTYPGEPPVYMNELTYSCHFDQIIDGQVDIATAPLCSTLTDVTFDTETGFFGWAPVSGSGNYELLLRESRDGNIRFRVTHIFIGAAPPADNRSPTVSGSAQYMSTVRLYDNPDCSGPVLGSGLVWPRPFFNIAANVPDNSTTTFFAQASDAAGNLSPCSSTSRVYVEDSKADPPSLNFAVPNSPANNNNPVMWGLAEPNSAVSLYSNSGCVDTPIANGIASPSGVFNIPVTVDDNTSTVIYAKIIDALGHVSSCSNNFLVYVEDSLAPAIPSVASVNPLSPANNNVPYVSGVAEPLATVQIFGNSLCLPPVLGSGVVSSWGSFSLPIFVADNTSNTFYAKAVDSSGNESACSTNFVVYIEDSLPPGPPEFLDLNPVSPGSPSNVNTPVLSGTAEQFSLVRLFGNPSCTGGVIGTGFVNALGIFAVTATVSDNSTNVIYAKAFDAAGNGSECSTDSVVYVEDSLPPVAPAVAGTNPPSPANDNMPFVLGVGEPLTTVTIHDDAQCVSAVLGTGTINAQSAFAVQIAVANNTSTQLFAKSIDEAGNVSSCSKTFVTYIEDSIAPSPPVLLFISPTPPANNNTPTLSGDSEALSTVKLYTTSDCSGVSIGTDVTDEAGKFAAIGTVVDNFNGVIFASATDKAGNTSICSPVGLPYIEDSIPPTVSFTLPRNGSSIGGAQLASFAVSGTCSEVPGFVEVIASCAYEVVPCLAGAWSSTLDLSTLCPGNVVLTASQEDLAKNVGSDDVNLAYFPNWDQFPYQQQQMAQFAVALQAVSSEQTAIASMHGTLSNSTNKWAGGVLAPNGHVYAMPFDATSVLKINPALPAVPIFVGVFAAGGNKWNGGVLAPNQMIYGIPRGATSILKINPANDQVSTFGNLTGSTKWIGSVVAPNGAIYGIPADSTSILKLLPADDSISTFGNISGSFKWVGGVLAPNGMIYGMPHLSSAVLKIDPSNDSFSTFGSLGSGAKWAGGVLAPNGSIYGIPYSSTTILKVDPNTDAVSLFGSIEGDQKYAFGALGPDGKIYAVPESATSVLVIDPVTDTVSTIALAISGERQFSGAVMAMDGSIYGIPSNATSVLRILQPLTVGPPNANFALSRHLNKL